MYFSNNFIKANDKLCTFENPVPAPYFRKSFNLDFKPQKAEITICGLGFYELYINGTNITKGPLAPYISNPEEVLYYDNYDVSKYLTIGENVIGVLLGNGHRNPYGAFIWDFDKWEHIGPVTFALCFEAEGNGKKITFEADESFKTHSSPITRDDLRMGYCYDARLEIPDWNKPGFDDSAWTNCLLEKSPAGFKKLCEAEPIIVSKELKSVKITHYDRLPFAHSKTDGIGAPIEETYRDNVYVYDFGINSAGLTKIKINGKPGQKITVRHAEELNAKGEFSVNTTVFERDERTTQLYRECGQVDSFICKGGYEEFVPKFKYDGFRYAYVEGLEDNQATEDAVTFLVMHSDVKKRADFSCSDEVLNKLYACAINSDYSNFYYFPTDCPHREKHGWTNDAWVSSEQMLLNLAVEKSLMEWLFNISKVQKEDGTIPGIVPTTGWGFAWGNGAFPDSVCVQIPYYLYKYTGSLDVITKNADMMIRYLRYASSRRSEDGLVSYGLPDWCDPYEKINHKIACPNVVSSSIAIFDIAEKAAFLFGKAGLDDNKEFSKKLALELKESFRNNLIDYATMTVNGDCQTSQVLGIYAKMFNEDEMPRAKAKLVEIIHRDNDINACGMYGKRFLFNVLSEMGESDLAYKMIVAKDIFSFGYWIENGATSLWERFKSVNDINADNSKNHHFYGHISSWFIQYIAGLKPNPDADDITYFEISPNFVLALANAKARYISGFGEVKVSWVRNCDKINLSVVAPKGTKGKIKLPSGYAFSDGEPEKTWNAEDGCNIEFEVINNISTEGKL